MRQFKDLFLLSALAAGALLLVACNDSDGDEPVASTQMPGMSMPTAEGSAVAAPFDAMFIDSMTEHHQGAIEMAQQALEEAEHPELQTLAREIIAAQQDEIDQMQAWREEWYPGLAPTGGMSMPMGTMEISPDASVPFDQRFIDAMIPHHEDAIMMANEALVQAEHVEIRNAAQAIIEAQTAEITQMEEWKAEWYGS